MNTLLISLFFLSVFPLAMAEDGRSGVNVVDPEEGYRNYVELKDEHEDDEEEEPGEGEEPGEEQIRFRYAVVCIKNNVSGLPSGTYFYKWKDYENTTAWFYSSDWIFKNIGYKETHIHWYEFPEGSQEGPKFYVFWRRNLKNETTIHLDWRGLNLVKMNSKTICPFSPYDWGFKFEHDPGRVDRHLFGPTDIRH